MKQSYFFTILIAVSCIGVFIYITTDNESNTLSENNVPEVDTIAIEPVKPKRLVYGWQEDSVIVEEDRIKYGENIAGLFTTIKVPESMITKLRQVPRQVFDPRYLKARNPYTVLYSQKDRAPRSFIYHEDKVNYVQFDFQDSLKVYRKQHQVDTVQQEITGTIESSLYTSILEGGSSPVLVNELADVYAWVIDFFGLQAGDQYKVIYDEYLVEGESAGLGPIKAASFKHMGEEFYAFRYDQGEGYEFFDEEGKSLRKTLLKAPLKYNRVSSGFSYSRLHPILKIRRPHLGVDYAAPTGTPVVSVGDGVVIEKKYTKGGGHMVKIKHNSNYTTAYLHLSRYGKGIAQGTVVKQGQVIGYVGSTGLSTGPHLDFRFWKNGKPVDPLKIDPPSSNPIKEEVLRDYIAFISFLKSRLDEIEISRNTGFVATKEGESIDDV